MPFCERLSEQLAIVATIDPVAGATGAVTTDVVAMGMHRRAMFILMRGAGVQGITCAIQEANAAFTAGTATILTRAATAADVAAEQHIFEVSAEAMGAGLTALRGVFTSVGTDLYAVLVLADVERYHPGSDQNLGSVASIQAAN